MERRWVSVGYPGGLSEGLWVLEYDTVMYDMKEKYNLLKSDAIRVSLAKTMDMKCEILKSLGAKFFSSRDQYDGEACLRAWEEKTQGEFGPLVQTKYEEEVPRPIMEPYEYEEEVPRSVVDVVSDAVKGKGKWWFQW
jgi:hypothetical protein